MKKIINTFIFLSIFGIYLKTLCPTVYVGDSGEITAASHLLGIPHPTGYPFFLLIAKSFSLTIPVSAVHCRLNILSALFSSLAIACLFLFLVKLKNSSLAGWIAAVSMALSATSWQNNIIAEVYSLNIFFMSAFLLTLQRFLNQKNCRNLCLTFLTAGFGMLHHGTFVLFSAPFLALLILYQIRSPRFQKRLVVASLFFVLSCSLILYLPIRSDAEPWINWENTNNLDGLVNHLTGKEFHEDMIVFDMPEVRMRLKQLTADIGHEFYFPLILCAFIGMPVMIRRNLLYGLSLLLTVSISILFCLTYQIPDIQPYFLTLWFVGAVWIGVGSDFILKFLKNNCRMICFASLAVTLLLLSSLQPLVKHYSNCDFSEVFIGRSFGIDILNTLEYDSQVRTRGWTAPFVLLSLLAVEKRRPDIALVTPLLDHFSFPLQSNQIVYHVSAADRRPPFGMILRQVGICLREVYPDERIIPRPWFESIYRVVPEIAENSPDNFLIDAVVAQYYYRRAEDQFVKGNIESTLRDLKSAESIAKNNARILNNLGQICHRIGLKHKAVYYFRKASQFSPDLPKIWNNLAVALLQMEKNQDAYQAFNAGIKYGMPPDAVHENAGDVFFEKGHFEAASREYFQIREVKPQNAEAFLKLGLSLKNRGLTEDAIIQFQKSLAANDSFPEAHLELGKLYLQKNSFQNALYHFQRAIELRPHSAAMHNLLGNAWYKYQNFELAEKYYKNAIHISPRIEFYNNLGALFIQTERYGQAVDLYLNILQRDPSFITAYNNLGTAYYYLQKIKKAAEMWEKSLLLAPEQNTIKKYLIELKTNLPKEAK